MNYIFVVACLSGIHGYKGRKKKEKLKVKSEKFASAMFANLITFNLKHRLSLFLMWLNLV